MVRLKSLARIHKEAGLEFRENIYIAISSRKESIRRSMRNLTGASSWYKTYRENHPKTCRANEAAIEVLKK